VDMDDCRGGKTVDFEVAAEKNPCDPGNYERFKWFS
jgi:hypothetical protein